MVADIAIAPESECALSVQGYFNRLRRVLCFFDHRPVIISDTDGDAVKDVHQCLNITPRVAEKLVDRSLICNE